MAEDLKPRLISPAAPGGLPVFNDDILQTQDNNRNTTKEQLEFLRSGINNNTGQLEFATGLNTSIFNDVGLILSGCVIDRTGVAPFPVSEGYVYIDGEVMKFPGANITETQWVEMKKGSVTNVQRTFKDGSPKDATEEYTLDFTITTFSPYGETPSYQGVQMIGLSQSLSELQTIVGAQSLLIQRGTGGNSNGILHYYNNPNFIDGGLEANVTGTIRSRIKETYESEVVLSLDVDTSTFSDAVADYTIGTLTEWTSQGLLRVTAYIKAVDPLDDQLCLINISNAGVVTIRRPFGKSTWVTIDGNSTYFVRVQTIAYAFPTAGRAYDGFDDNFMTKS